MFFKSPSGWLFIKHEVRFFSATQWRIFIEIGRHGVRSGLPVWMRKTCFQAAIPASMAIGRNPQIYRFLFSFSHGSLSLIIKNNQKKRDFLLLVVLKIRSDWFLNWSGWLLLNVAKRNVFSPPRSRGLFIKWLNPIPTKWEERGFDEHRSSLRNIHSKSLSSGHRPWIPSRFFIYFIIIFILKSSAKSSGCPLNSKV